MIIHSYIGQTPVYDTNLQCTIYPAPDYKAPEFMTPKPYKESKPQQRRFVDGTYHGNRDKIIAWLRENGPATCSVIAKALGTRTKNVDWCFRSNKNKLFCVLGVTDDDYENLIYGLDGQTLADMKINCNAPRLRKIVADALSKLGEARATEIALTMGINVRSVRFCLSHNKDLFTCTKLSITDFVWKLKETD